MLLLWIGLIWVGACTVFTMLWILMSALSRLQFEIIEWRGNFLRPDYSIENHQGFSTAH
jgi:hypothetical protein